MGAATCSQCWQEGCSALELRQHPAVLTDPSSRPEPSLHPFGLRVGARSSLRESTFLRAEVPRQPRPPVVHRTPHHNARRTAGLTSLSPIGNCGRVLPRSGSVSRPRRWVQCTSLLPARLGATGYLRRIAVPLGSHVPQGTDARAAARGGLAGSRCPTVGRLLWK